MRNRIVKMAVCALCWMTLAAATGVNAAEAARASRVLILSDQSGVMPGVSTILRKAESVIRAAHPEQVEFNAEYLDASRYPEEKLSPLFLNYVREKYASRTPDLIIALCTVRFDLVAEFAKSVFPGVPVVLVGLTEEALSLGKFGPNVTGFIQRADLLGTMELILKLQPGIRRIVVIGGAASLDQVYLNRTRVVAWSLEDRVAVEFWTGRSMTELEKEVSTLDRDTAVFFTSMFRDSTGETFVPVEAGQRIVERASVPVYGFIGGMVNVGAVGGSVFGFEAMGERAGQLARGILEGGSANLKPLEFRMDSRPVFNQAALRRWAIHESRLPPGSTVLSLNPSVWEKYRWYIFAGVVIISIQAAMIIGLILQRTRLLRAEREVREGHDFMELATDAGHLGLWVRDLTTGEFWTNPRLRWILGFGEKEPLVIENLFGRIHPGDRDRVLSLVRRSMKDGQSFEIECRLLLPDGAERWVLVKGSGVLEPEGRLVRAQGVMVDKTETKIAEIEADRQREEAAHIQRVSMMGELAASLAHELNQPLTAILSNVQAAQRFLAANPPDLKEVREILRDVVKDDNRASEVIRRLRALARKESPNFAPLDMSNLVRDVVQLTHSDAVQHNMTVLLECGNDLPQVWGDRVQLPQVMLNLLLNAFDAMKDSTDDERRVVIRTVQEDDRTVRVAVSDRGKGLGEDTLDKIFEPFFTTKREGLGMGLAISRSIVKAHGGHLWVENNPDRGATFNFTVQIDRRRNGRFDSRSGPEMEMSDAVGPS